MDYPVTVLGVAMILVVFKGVLSLQEIHRLLGRLVELLEEQASRSRSN
jgi:hypothetical protein